MIDWRINRISPGSNSNGCACGFSMDCDSPTIFQEDKYQRHQKFWVGKSIGMAKKIWPQIYTLGHGTLMISARYATLGFDGTRYFSIKATTLLRAAAVLFFLCEGSEQMSFWSR